MDISQLVESLEFRFMASGIDNAKRVAEELLAHAFDCKPLAIYTGTVWEPEGGEQTFALIRRIETLAERIEKGEPLQYVVGHVDFWGLQIKCDPRALIPRSETEILVEEVLSSNIWTHNPVTLVDVGTGTGCIALTLASQRPSGRYTAIDLSEEALSLAKENASSLGLADAIEWRQSSLLNGFEADSLDAVVANLPYIPTPEWEKLDKSVRDHEPRTALDSGPDGTERIEELAIQARRTLHSEGMLFLEIGYDQGRSVCGLLQTLGYKNIQIKHDLANLDRIAIAENP